MKETFKHGVANKFTLSHNNGIILLFSERVMDF